MNACENGYFIVDLVGVALATIVTSCNSDPTIGSDEGCYIKNINRAKLRKNKLNNKDNLVKCASC